MLRTPNLVLTDGNRSYKVTVPIHAAEKSSGMPFLERGAASVVE